MTKIETRRVLDGELLEGGLVEELLLVHAGQHLPEVLSFSTHFTTSDATSAR